MENEEILKKAIKKAIDNNFLGLAGNPKIEINVYLTDLNDIPVDPIKEPEKEICIISDWTTHSIEGEDVDCEPECCGIKRFFSVNDLIFNQEFAKCFWGISYYFLVEKETGGYEDDDFYLEWMPEKETEGDENYRGCLESWEHHLQKLATEPDKIKYLEKFI